MRHRRHRHSQIPTIFKWGGVCVLALIFVLLIVINQIQERKESERLEALRQEIEEQEALEEEALKMNIESDLPDESNTLVSACDVLSGEAQGEILVSAEEFAEDVELSISNSNGIDVSMAYLSEMEISVNATDLIVLQFTAYTEEASVTLEVTINYTQTNTIYLTETETDYYIPVTGIDEIEKITFKTSSEYSPTILDSVYLVNYGDSYSVNELMSGAWAQDDREVIELTSGDSVAESSSQVLTKDGYLYAIGSGVLTSYRIETDGTLTEVSSVESMGTTRDMVFSENEDFIIVTARQNGAYFIDITDPESLQLISHYDTLEATTGISVSGNYAFMASRYFGIEIVDISDPSNPVQISVVTADSDSEYQDCTVDGCYLYVGIYGQKRVDIYNIEDLNNCELVAEIDTDGAAQGLTVEDGILYISTGLNSQNSSTEIWEYGKGTGNGMELYDVSDPSDPVHLSTVKANGRMSYTGKDVWDVQVIGEYAYVTDMQNGLLIYDVSDVYSPVCVEEVQITTGITEYDLTTFAMSSWDSTETGRGAVYHVAVQDGVVWIASVDSGVYRIELDYAVEDTEENTDVILTASGEKTSEALVLYNYSSAIYDVDGCVWAAATDDDKIYLACGEAGIQVYDSNMDLIEVVDSDYSVKDIKISYGYLYTAESEGGIGIYEMGDSLTKISGYDVNGNVYCVSQIQLTSDGKYLVAQASTSNVIVLDVSDPCNPVLISDEEYLVTSRNTYYFRNIVTGLVNGLTVGIAGRSGINWYTSSDGELALNSETSNPFYYERGGMAAYGELCIAACSKGYQYFYIDDIDGATKVTVDDNMTGNAKISIGDGILVETETSTGNIYILDISDIDAPVLMEAFTVDGNPDIAVVDEEEILIPLRYGGLLKLERIE